MRGGGDGMINDYVVSWEEMKNMKVAHTKTNE